MEAKEAFKDAKEVKKKEVDIKKEEEKEIDATKKPEPGKRSKRRCSSLSLSLSLRVCES
jgi:hypothetical protein